MKQPSEVSSALLDVGEQQRLLEAQRLKTERKQLRMSERAAHLKIQVDRVMADAAAHVALKRHMFKTDEQLRGLKLTDQQIAIVRQWEVPKKSTAFGVESSAKLIEAKTRSDGEKPGVKINVQNATLVLPEKTPETMQPVVIEVVPGDK